MKKGKLFRIVRDYRDFIISIIQAKNDASINVTSRKSSYRIKCFRDTIGLNKEIYLQLKIFYNNKDVYNINK